MYEVRFHGRGGQGAVTAAELLAAAAAYEGKFSQAFPFFGVERRGAPVTSFLRIDSSAIRLHQQIYYPDAIVVLDSSLLSGIDFVKTIKPETIAIVNARKVKEELGIPLKGVWSVDATGIAIKNIGAAITNTAMLGAFAKATKMVTLESINRAIDERFPPQMAVKNKAAVKECFESLV